MLKNIIIAAALFSTVASAALADVTSNSTSGAAANTNTSTYTATQQGQHQGQGQTQTSLSGASSDQTQSTSSQASSNQSQSTTAQQGNAQIINYNSPSKETIRSAPSIAAPALTTTLTETCMGSYTGGVSFIGGAVTGGGTVVDKACVRRLNARELAQTLGDRDAAKEVMCGDADVARAYKMIGRPCLTAPIEPAPAPVPAPPAPTHLDAVKIEAPVPPALPETVKTPHG